MWTTRDFKSMDFGEPLGKKTMSPMYFEELEAIPKMIPSLVNTGFYIAGTHWFSDMIIMPIVFLGLKLFPQKGLSLFGKLLFWSWGRFTTPPYRVILQMEAESDTEKKTVQLSHEDGYWFTAIPVAACLIQYINKMLPTSGYHYMGHIVDTEHLMTTMKSMGIVIKETNN